MHKYLVVKKSIHIRYERLNYFVEFVTTDHDKAMQYAQQKNSELETPQYEVYVKVI